jgi:hypothetical protein
MDLQPTLISLAAGVLTTVLFGWLGARPWDLRKGPRLMPWRFLMMLSATFTLFMAAHALNLVGVTTGR